MTILSQIEAGVLPARFTVADLDRLTEEGLLDPDEKFELIEGEIIPIPPKSSAHERFKRVLNRHLVMSAPAALGVWIEPSIIFEEHTYLDPDIVLFKATIESRDARGPDLMLVIEVAASSLDRDMRRKALLYARYGVRDYWVVDTQRRTIIVHREPRSDGFSSVFAFGDDQRIEALLIPGLSVRLADLV